MTQASYVARVKSSARRQSDDPDINFISGKEVFIFPESGKWIPGIKDHQFQVIPTGKIDHDKRFLVCRRFLRPLEKNTQKVFERLTPGEDCPPRLNI